MLQNKRDYPWLFFLLEQIRNLAIYKQSQHQQKYEQGWGSCWAGKADCRATSAGTSSSSSLCSCCCTSSRAAATSAGSASVDLAVIVADWLRHGTLQLQLQTEPAFITAAASCRCGSLPHLLLVYPGPVRVHFVIIESFVGRKASKVSTQLFSLRPVTRLPGGSSVKLGPHGQEPAAKSSLTVPWI